MHLPKAPGPRASAAWGSVTSRMDPSTLRLRPWNSGREQNQEFSPGARPGFSFGFHCSGREARQKGLNHSWAHGGVRNQNNPGMQVSSCRRREAIIHAATRSVRRTEAAAAQVGPRARTCQHRHYPRLAGFSLRWAPAEQLPHSAVGPRRPPAPGQDCIQRRKE